MGRLSPEKGTAGLLAAWASAQPSGLHLTIVGDGPLRTALEARLVPNVTFLGWRDQEEVRGLMLSARALVFPLRLVRSCALRRHRGAGGWAPRDGLRTGQRRRSLGEPWTRMAGCSAHRVGLGVSAATLVKSGNGRRRRTTGPPTLRDRLHARTQRGGAARGLRRSDSGVAPIRTCLTALSRQKSPSCIERIYAVSPRSPASVDVERLAPCGAPRDARGRSWCVDDIRRLARYVIVATGARLRQRA